MCGSRMTASAMRRFAPFSWSPTAPVICGCATGSRARIGPTSIVVVPSCAASGSPKVRRDCLHFPGALANSAAIAQRGNRTPPLGHNHLPEFPTPVGVTIDEHLRDEAAIGLERRLAKLYADSATRDAKRPAYLERLDFEARTIVQM